MTNLMIIVVLGNAGSGKGTQTKLLQEKFGLDYIGSGDILRARQDLGDFTGNKLKEVMNKGALVPTAVVFKIWSDKWDIVKNKPDFKGLVMDGSPREIMEAKLMDQSFEWYEWDRYVKVLLIDISREEAFSRLLKRARTDDTEGAVNKRLDLFEEEVSQVIEYYEKSGRLIHINGEQNIENVHKDIMKAVS